MDDPVFGGDVRVEGVVVDDGLAEVEDGGFGDIAIYVVVVGSVEMYGVVEGIRSRAHVGVKNEEEECEKR